MLDLGQRLDRRCTRPSFLRTLFSAVQDLTAGTLAGAGQLVVGHPFDTIKVRLLEQAQVSLPTLQQFISGV